MASSHADGARRTTRVRRRLIALPVVALLVSPALMGDSNAAKKAKVVAPTFRQYHAPAELKSAREAGEPTLTYNPKTGTVMFMANLATYRVSSFDLRRNDRATWVDVTDPLIGVNTNDPIMHRDPVTGRVFINQLHLAGSLQVFTDDEGKTYTKSALGNALGPSIDHQSVSTGKPSKAGTYPKPVGYPSYVYYCTNDLAAATCAVSVDGGLSFLAARPVYSAPPAPARSETAGACGGLFGHVKTDPRDGTVYMPPKDCYSSQKLYVSTDNTFSWTGYDVPDTTVGDAGHPSVAVGRQDGAVYLAWGSGDGSSTGTGSTGRVQVAASLDKGKTWKTPATLGREHGVVAARFPIAVAGDRGRAAVAFLGSSLPGNPSGGDEDTYWGEWYLYVSYTADYGRTWKTYNATPRDPVQIGPVCTNGLGCLEGRNLLDFNDMTLDGTGRVVIAMADGVTNKEEDFRHDVAHATIVRQVGGPSLYAGR